MKFIKDWKNQDAAKYAMRMYHAFGPPQDYSMYSCTWKDVDGASYIKVKDEEIQHSFPSNHTDFVYYAKYYDFKSEMPGTAPEEIKYAQQAFAEVSGSILFDGLKQKVCGRCANTMAGAVTVRMVEDFMNGTMWQNMKQEYAERIEEMDRFPKGFHGKADKLQNYTDHVEMDNHNYSEDMSVIGGY